MSLGRFVIFLVCMFACLFDLLSIASRVRVHAVYLPTARGMAEVWRALFFVEVHKRCRDVPLDSTLLERRVAPKIENAGNISET